jgi:tetratricopeptide (TPR) repeat protein
VRKIANSFIFDYHDEIAKLDGSTKLRERLVTDGVNYLDAVAGEETDNPELLKESAIAYRKIGDAQGKPYMANLGKLEDAIQSYRKSVALLEKASLLAPFDFSLKDELVESYRVLANVEGRGGNKEQAKQILQKALAVNKELISTDENNVERKISSINLQIALSDTTYEIKLLERALAEANALYSFQPHNENLNYALRKLHSRISTFSRFNGKSEERTGNLVSARNLFLQSLEHSNRQVYYVKTSPNAMSNKRWVFDAYLNYTEDLSKVGRSEEALKNLAIAEKTLQDIKQNNADDREIVIFEIWFLSVKQAILKQQNKPEIALAVTEKALNLAVERTESDPTNLEPISWTLNLANEAVKLAGELKKERQAGSYRQICLKYKPQFKERFDGDFSCVF